MNAINNNNQQVITACAFIHHNFDGVEKVFVAKRADTKKFMPGVYELPGGHVEAGETPIDALKREILEELGVHISIGEQFDEFSYSADPHVTQKNYFARFEDDIEKIHLNVSDHSDFKWIAENELGEILSKDKGSDDPEIKAIKKGFEILKKSRKTL